MKYEPLGGGLIIEESDKDYVFGSGQLTGKVIRPDGDWSAYIPQHEDQRKRDIESSACATFGTINCIEILMEEMGLGKDFDYSERFIALLSGTTKQGNSPTKVAEAIRKYGLIPQSMMPFDDSIKSWEDFMSWKGVDKDKCLAAGRQWLKRYEFGYDLVWKGDISPEDKAKLMDEARKYSPLGISVFAWLSDNGIYYKLSGADDNHWVAQHKKDTALDTYDPYEKKLRTNYDHMIALRYVIKKKVYKPELGFFSALLNTLRNLW